MNNISKRLQVIAQLVNKEYVADVGCDHGKLADYLLRQKKIKHITVSDISRPSLQKAIDLLSKNNYNFDYICCDGLTGFNEKFIEQCIIAGMGGDEIIKIISNSPIDIESYILSPQHNIIEVKEFMFSIGFCIDFDIIIKDKNKFYNIFRCEKSSNNININYSDMIIGKDNLNNSLSDINEFVDYEISKIENILKNHNKINSKLIDYLNVLKKYKEGK